MAKKKNEAREEQAVISDRQSADDVEAQGYTVGLWAWKPQYLCKQCQFDTLDLKVMEEHLLLAHRTTPALTPPPDLTPSPSPEGEGRNEERADGIFEIDLKEDQ